MGDAGGAPSGSGTKSAGVALNLSPKSNVNSQSGQGLSVSTTPIKSQQWLIAGDFAHVAQTVEAVVYEIGYFETFEFAYLLSDPLFKAIDD